MRPREELPAAYVRSCEKFFKEISSKRQASSSKRQASSSLAGLNDATIKLYKQNRKREIKI